MTFVVRLDPLGFHRLYQVTLWGTKCISPPCLTAAAAWNHAPNQRK